MSFTLTARTKKNRKPQTPPKGPFLCPNGDDYATHITSLILDKARTHTDVEIYPLVYEELFNTALNFDVDNKPTFLIISLKRYGHSFINKELLPTNIVDITSALLEHKNKLLGGLEIYTDGVFTDIEHSQAKMKNNQVLHRSKRNETLMEYDIVASRINE